MDATNASAPHFALVEATAEESALRDADAWEVWGAGVSKDGFLRREIALRSHVCGHPRDGEQRDEIMAGTPFAHTFLGCKGTDRSAARDCAHACEYTTRYGRTQWHVCVCVCESAATTHVAGSDGADVHRDNVLSSCETFRFPVCVFDSDSVSADACESACACVHTRACACGRGNVRMTRGIGLGIASVLTSSHARRQGHAGRMLEAVLAAELQRAGADTHTHRHTHTHTHTDARDDACRHTRPCMSILYTDVDPRTYSRIPTPLHRPRECSSEAEDRFTVCTHTREWTTHIHTQRTQAYTHTRLWTLLDDSLLRVRLQCESSDGRPCWVSVNVRLHTRRDASVSRRAEEHAHAYVCACVCARSHTESRQVVLVPPTEEQLAWADAQAQFSLSERSAELCTCVTACTCSGVRMPRFAYACVENASVECVQEAADAPRDEFGAASSEDDRAVLPGFTPGGFMTVNIDFMDVSEGQSPLAITCMSLPSHTDAISCAALQLAAAFIARDCGRHRVVAWDTAKMCSCASVACTCPDPPVPFSTAARVLERSVGNVGTEGSAVKGKHTLAEVAVALSAYERSTCLPMAVALQPWLVPISDALSQVMVQKHAWL